MAKRTNDGTTKQTAGETKARRAPVRRRTAMKKDVATASAADMAAGGPIGSAPSKEDIARLAYALYLGRGGASGSHLEDWYEAERRLKAQR